MNRLMSFIACAVLTLLAVPVSRAQDAPWFELAVAGPGEEPITLQGVLEVEVDDIVIDYREILAGDGSVRPGEYRLYGPGKAHWGNARITLAPGPHTDWLYQWWEETARGKNIRKNITVTLFKSDKTPGRTYSLFDSFPTSWKASELNGNSASAVQTETLTVKIGRIEFKTRTAPPSPPSPPGNVSVWLDPDDDGDMLPDTWDSWGGGEPVLIVSQLFNGAQFRTNSLGHKTVSELTLRGSAFLSKKGYDYWMARTLEGDPWMNSLTLTETGQAKKGAGGASGKGGKTYVYHDCFPVRYVFPRMSVTNTTGNVIEEVTVKPIRVEMK